MAKKKENSAENVMRAYIYGRYSSHAQKDTSIEQQFAEIKAYCEASGIRIVGEYADRAISGRTDERPQFQKMIKDCARGGVQLVVCWKVDRFARNRYDAAMYKARLKKYGVRVQYAKESIPDGPEGILLESILEGSAEYYSANLAQNVKRGMRANALECKVNHGPYPLGYTKGADGRYEIDPDGAAVVREIFDLYVNGDVPIIDICKILNGRGLRTVRGGEFGKGSFRSLLRNEMYIGVYEYMDVRVEGGVPPIVDRDIFEAAQRKIDRHARKPASTAEKVNYILTGRLFCGHCGSAMVGVSGTGRKGGKYYYYACMGQKKSKICEKKPEKKDALEELIVKNAVECALSDEMIEIVAERVAELQRREREDDENKRAVESQLADVKTRLKNVIEAVESGAFSPALKSRLSELEKQKAQLEDELERLRVVSPMFSKSDIIEWLKRFRDGDVSNPNYRWAIVQNFVNAVYVYDDKIKIVYNYGVNNSILPLSTLESEPDEGAVSGSYLESSGRPDCTGTNTRVIVFTSPAVFVLSMRKTE